MGDFVYFLLGCVVGVSFLFSFFFFFFFFFPPFVRLSFLFPC